MAQRERPRRASDPMRKTQVGAPAGVPAQEANIVDSVMVLCGMRIFISRSRRRGSFSAELVFEDEAGSDRAVVDAGSAEELESLIHAVAYPAALARRRASSEQQRLRGLA